RTFYVTLNRPATITIDTFATTNGLINNDTVTVTGNVSDPDGNQITVLYSVNDAAFTEIYNGLNGQFTFNFPVKLLNVGANTIKVKAVDSYSAETIKTITMKKEENLVTLARGENRYKVTPPNGRARGLVLWIERDSTLEVKARISMVNEGQPEVFEDMVWNRTENVSTGILEDEFKIQVDEAKTKISLIVEVIGGNGAIRLISGVLAE
ncbi:hypothetical protein NYE67_20750, partial [Solibacillus sp. FSL W8-0474]|uniref:hypothetical protein n=1 Tax=Solibacillus sp. FSL W8-0474 TaxID=2975336 RepID=UPI0030F87BE2